MLYRDFGKTGRKVSALGFGCMRLPVVDGDAGKIDENKATEMLRYAIDKGVNYVDTAYVYHKGQSELFLGRALKNGYREKVNLATKLPSWLIKSREGMDIYLNEQLRKLQTDYIDFYLVHSLSAETWGNLKDCGIFDFLDCALKDGRIKYAGFSFHDDLSLFKEIVDSYPWSFCQIQYNYLDEYYQAGTEGLKYAVDRGLAVAIMEPLRGGKLAVDIPKEARDVWDRAEVKRSPAEWGFKFLWDKPEIGVVLSGMTEMEQAAENIKLAENAYPDTLTEKEKALIKEVRDIYKKRMKIDCTSCKYCLPCPSGVDIPENFRHFNNASMFDDIPGSKKQYNMFMEDSEKASKCQECGLCEEHCPQHIKIRDMLKEVVKAFE